MLDHFDEDARPQDLLSLNDIKAEIRRRVPAVYTPPPFEDVFRREDDLHFRQDFLKLAKAPTFPGFFNKLKTLFKMKLVQSLEWVFMRQVDFNEAVAHHACESARVSAALDGNMSELFTAMTALLREMDQLTERQQRSDAKLAELAALRSQTEFPAESPSKPGHAFARPK